MFLFFNRKKRESGGAEVRIVRTSYNVIPVSIGWEEEGGRSIK